MPMYLILFSFLLSSIHVVQQRFNALAETRSFMNSPRIILCTRCTMDMPRLGLVDQILERRRILIAPVPNP